MPLFFSRSSLETGHTSGSKLGVNVTKLVLLFLIFKIARAHLSARIWPIVTWSVYSNYARSFPDPTASTLAVSAISKTGDRYLIEPYDLMPSGHDENVRDAFEYAFHADDLDLQQASRVYLFEIITRLLKDVEIETIESKQIIWKVDPLAVPPLVRDTPEEITVLGSFAVANYQQGSSSISSKDESGTEDK